MECPIATQDQKVNDRNKAEAESKAKYAEAGDEEYSCGNCSRFIQTPDKSILAETVPGSFRRRT